MAATNVNYCIISSDVITVSQLKEFLEGWDPDGEVWIETGRGLSSPVKAIYRLGVKDVILETNEIRQ